MNIKQALRKIDEATEWVESRPIVCGMIAALIGLTAGLIFGANI